MKEREKKVCMHCGATEAGQHGLIPVYGYDWDNPDDNVAGSIQVVLGHICAQRVECAERNIERAYNPEVLREVIRDAENYSADLRSRAKQALSEIAELARTIAHFNDQEAREQGYGAIGH